MVIFHCRDNNDDYCRKGMEGGGQRVMMIMMDDPLYYWGLSQLTPMANKNVTSYFQPKVVSDTDDLELAKQLEKLEEQNREVAGDDDADSYDDEEGSAGEEN